MARESRQPPTCPLWSVPPPTNQPDADSAVALTLSLLDRIFGPLAQRRFAVRLWTGQTSEAWAVEQPAFTLVLKHAGALRAMLTPPAQTTMGEAYLRDDFDIEGDLVAATALASDLAPVIEHPMTWPGLLRDLLRLPASSTAAQDVLSPPTAQLRGVKHSVERDKLAVRSHYDVGNDFYRLWLDKNMVYSCAYFPNGDEDLDAAQEKKLKLICRKLGLQAGQRLLDVGCGWGGLVVTAARDFGVKALGITLSEQQASFARERIARAGLERQCEVRVRDYRELPTDEPFDRIVSVGMVEHVGLKRLPTYFQQAHRLLRPGGLFLNHGITLQSAWPAHRVVQWMTHAILRQQDFVFKYVFPDGELLPVHTSATIAEQTGFEVRDIENLREHYALTLRQWVRRLEEHRDEATRLVGERTYRVWRLYMAGSAHAFEHADIGIHQMLLGKPDDAGRTDIPMWRGSVYTG